VGEDSKMPVRQISPADAPKASSDYSPQDFVRRQVLIQSASNGFDVGSLQRLVDNLGVQPQLIAEVIIDRGHVLSGNDANLANRGGLVAAVGKDWASGVEQFF